ncbi:hypothetical protein AQUCO_00201123v1 [Aquilegia coerulea]|uniref:Choline transporter-like protein n=1 Tax=Aquilegia coerulea TaxID=218851 RepID=A0A2G5F6C1_AQUCA|nr:hypothetical protein AQUCO_00201123v1 [Aquilegia coerulea]
MSHSPSPSSDTDSSSITTVEQDGGRIRQNGSQSQSPGMVPEYSRHWRDVFWLGIFIIHLISLGAILGVLGINRFQKADRLDIDRFTTKWVKNKKHLTETYWPFYAAAAGVGTFLGGIWLSLLGSKANQMMKISVHILTTYLAVISVFCFWGHQILWGVVFAIGATLQLLYVISVIERLPFTMLVLQKAVKLVWNLPEVMRVSYAFMCIMLLWMVIWSFGAAGIVAASMGDSVDDSLCWWLLVALSVSLFWTGAVLCNTVHVIASGMVFLVLIHGGREAATMPSKPLVKSLRHAVTTSFGSICYGSLFTAAIRMLRWEIRGLRSKIGSNECLLCCVDFLFHLVETLVRFFNKYAYVQIAVYGKSFNHSARDAWELFQSTGVEALVAYDCSGAVLLMGTILGGLITGTCSGLWAWNKDRDRVVMVGFTAMLMGMILVGLAMVVVESAVTSIYICYAEDPLLIHRWDADFFNQISEMLHQRLQHRSSTARDVRFNERVQEAVPI